MGRPLDSRQMVLIILTLVTIFIWAHSFSYIGSTNHEEHSQQIMKVFPTKEEFQVSHSAKKNVLAGSDRKEPLVVAKDDSLPENVVDTQFSENRTSNTHQRKSSDATAKPYFILHVGPPKTATTTIQCGLSELSAQLAAQDKYVYVGKKCPFHKGPMPNGEDSIPGHFLMMGLISANRQSRGIEALQARMAYHKRQGNHMIFSIEAMSNHLDDKPEVWELFLSLFEGWQVRVVVGYRHYFDWLRSMYFQQNIGNRFLDWPRKGKLHPSFLGYLDYHMQRFEANNPSNDGASWGQHLSLYAIEYFGAHFDDIHIFDLHQEGDVLTNFVCQMLPSADNICKGLSEKILRVDHSAAQRQSHSFDADRLAEAAYDLDYIDKDTHKMDVVKKVKGQLAFSNFTSDMDVRQCPSEQLQARFLNASLAFERRIFTVANSRHQPKLVAAPHSTTRHKQLFQEAFDKHKFCEVNTTEVLKHDDWVEFFKKIVAKKE